MHSFSPTTPTPRGCTHLPLVRWRLHCILLNGRRKGRQLHCLRFLTLFSSQVDCARKNRHLTHLTLLIKSLITPPRQFSDEWRPAFRRVGQRANIARSQSRDPSRYSSLADDGRVKGRIGFLWKLRRRSTAPN